MHFFHRPATSLLAGLMLCLALPSIPATAGPLRDLIKERRQASATGDLPADGSSAPFALPTGVTMRSDVAYGSDPRQRMDVYLPASTAATATSGKLPVIFMVHGGGWRTGDKAMDRVVENKVAHWVPSGFILVSANYRMLPETPPLEQARDVARALARAQALSGEWGGDANRFILMGHSAGAHLVALLTASPVLARQQGAAPWLGTVALDSAAMDVVQVMKARHYRLYDQAFGNDPAIWAAASPTLQLTADAVPLLAVCSSRRDDSCAQANGLKARADALGVRVEVLPQDFSHKQINAELGLPGAYTQAVDAFIATLYRPVSPPGMTR
ncbi:MAG: alpha/beta hydrolase [Moraxellaceae bacterium]